MSTPQAIRVLVLEDNPADADLMIDALRQAGYRVTWDRTEREREFTEHLEREPDLILSDYRLPQFNGMQALKIARARALDVPFILVSGTIGEDLAVEAMRLGADDYLLKDRMARLGEAARHALERRRLHAQQKDTRREVRRLAAIVENSNDAIISRTLDGIVTSWNGGAERTFGYAAGEAVGRPIAELILPPYTRSRIDRNIARVRRGEIVAPYETQRMTKAGKLIDVLSSVSPIRNEAGEIVGAAIILRDVSERKQAEAHIRRVSRARQMISDCNQFMVRETSEQALLDEVCRIAVEQGGYLLAWVGNREHDPDRTVRPVAHAGVSNGYVENARITWAHGPRGEGPTGQAIRSGRTQVMRDIAGDPGMTPWREEALRRGYSGSVALPLIAGGEAFGVLGVYTAEPNVVDQDEVALLEEFAGDLAFGVSAIRERAARRHAETALARVNRVLAVLSAINTLIVRVRDRDTLFREACRIAVEQGDFGIAWIGTYDPGTFEVTPAAIAGLPEDDYLRTARHDVREDAPPRGSAVGIAIRERRPVYNNDITANAGEAGARRREAIRRGYHSVIALPLMTDGCVVGSFSLYAREVNFFNEEEVKLLAELAGDISFALEHMARQVKIDKLSRVRAVSSRVNEVIVRIKDRQSLYDAVARIAVEQGRFGMAWVSEFDPESQAATPVAWAGEGVTDHVGYKSTARSDTPVGRGVVGRAIREKQPVVCNDLTAEVDVGSPRRRLAISKGYRSLAGLPLIVDGKVVATVTLYAGEAHFFDDEEMALLSELAGNISFALENMAKQEQLDYLSFYDSLTGLPNRTLFVDRAGQQMRARGGEPRMLAMILTDLERFRYINDSFGHHGGDELLRQVARRLEQAFHGKDYLARIGNDHFGILIRGVQDATRVAHVIENELFGCFREPFVIAGRELRVPAKAGVAMYPTDGLDAEALFRNAEAAMKRARASADRFVFYASEMNARAAQMLSLETRLRKATEARQFVLHYQPKFDLAGGAICGLEALIRWQDPEQGLVPPGAFIPLLEETGLIVEVGKWALAQALADHRKWTALGLGVPRVAVNVSAIQLQQGDFTDSVVAAVREHGDNPGALELEVTESLLMTNLQSSMHKLSALRALGVSLAMDDFGTGYSSLSYLARLPIDSVKIDRSFVQGMTANPQHMVIVTTIIALAHSLNLRVVAEGVETEEQLHRLETLGCDEVQGFLFSRPLPAPGIEALLLSKRQIRTLAELNPA